MTRPARYAIYYAPPEPLWAIGASWLGRDADGSLGPVEPPGHLDRAFWENATASPRHYGLHATLKPPFHLREGKDEDGLLTAVRAIAGDQTPFELPALQVSAIGRFLALTLADRCARLHTFADLCVKALDHYRAPPSTEELERRRRAGLTRPQEAYLSEWGYPYVFAEYRFHITLTNAIGAEADRARLRQAAERHFPSDALKPRLLDGIAVYRQPERNAPFTVLERVSFTQRAAPHACERHVGDTEC